MRASMAWLVLLVACNAAPAPQKDSAQPTDPAASVAANDVMDMCPGEAAGDGCGDAPAADANQTHFGKAFAIAESETLSGAATRVGDGEQTVQVTGTVEAVCKKKGCWMELKDGDTSAKVFTYSGDFFLPVSTAKGRKAVVEGKLKVKTITEEFAQHLAQDEGVDPAAVRGPQKKIVIDADSITLL